MMITKVNKSNYKLTEWSGGTTNEIFIWPEGANFKEGNYDFRLSIATVNVSSSVFTKLPDVDRILMLLKGELKLIHSGQHETFLLPGAQDAFQGDWDTDSLGVSTNFNLMMKGKTNGKLTYITENSDVSSDADMICIFNVEGTGKVAQTLLLENDLVVIEYVQDELKLETNGRMVMVEVYLAS